MFTKPRLFFFQSIVYYSGHLPSLLRMNRTSSEFAISVIFDALLKAAINFTDVQDASRQASCEDNLIGYLLEEIMPHLRNILWGKVMNSCVYKICCFSQCSK